MVRQTSTECPACGDESESWDTHLSAQYSGGTKAMICPSPSCDVIHFKAAPNTL